MSKQTNKLILIVGFICMSFTIQAQDQLKAVADNYYLKPGSAFILDVLQNDDPGLCTSELGSLQLTILTPSPAAGSDVTWSVIAGNKIRIITKATARGQHVIRYRITCPISPSQSSEADIYVNLAERPDFIDDASCTIDPPEVVWDIVKKMQSTENIFYLALPLVGDLDGDGKPEIVVSNMRRTGEPTPLEGHNSTHMMVFNNDLTLKYKFPITDTSGNLVGVLNYLGHPFALGAVTKDGIGKILVATSHVDGFKLRCYKEDGTLVWVSSDGTNRGIISEVSYFNNPAGKDFVTGAGATPIIADMDGDGEVEILVGDRIFDGATGQLLASLPEGLTPGGYPLGRGFKLHDNTSGGSTFQPVLADITGDGKMEVIAGNTTYSVHINRDNPALSTVSVLASVDMVDGLTSVADIDGDGILDVVVVSRRNNNQPGFPAGDLVGVRLYVWQGSTGSFIGTPVYPKRPNGSAGSGGSRAFIGDINNDGKPEICFTHGFQMEAFAYDGTALVPLWFNKTTSDSSGSTTMTMFDFNLDGESELVYRDETHIRILDKNGDNVKDPYGNDAIFDCHSGTHTECPVVVDLDGDGHAEILVSGAETFEQRMQGVKLMVFTSKTPDIWAPARPVWNQHGYNPVYVNEDLTIPRYPLSQTTKTIHAEDNSVHTPFNSFMEQVGWLNLEGKPLGKAPDLAFDLSKNQRMSYNDVTDVMTITANVTNAGSKDFNDDILLSLYTYTQVGNQYSLAISKIFLDQKIDINDQISLTLTIPNYSTISLPTYDFLYLTINLVDDSPNAPKPFYKDIIECNVWNNTTSRISYVNGHAVLCKDDSAMLTVDPPGSYDCYWFTVNESGAKVPYPSIGNNKGDSKLVTKKTDDDLEFFLIDIHKRGSSTPLSSASDTVFIYRAMDTLVWNGSVNNDWHNTMNWDAPEDPTHEKRIRYIPGSCTNVLIPKANEMNQPLPNYPILATSGTSYSTYLEPRCNNITFEHVGEVSNVDMLKYSKAYVQLDIQSNRWYCFAPPLRNFYTGDIYKTDGNPFNDGVFVFTRLFSQLDPDYQSYIEGNWGRAFSTPTQTFAPGGGLGLWVDDLDPDPASHMTENFEFPKHDPYYYSYSDEGQVTGGPHYVADRSLGHRFIFEETINSTTKDVPLKVEGLTRGKDVLVGNPYLSHLDFVKFYDKNKNLIEPRYRVMEADGMYATYYLPGGGASTGNPVLTQYIAPMQSVLLTVKAPITAANPLITNGTMTLQKPGSSLRSGAEQNKFLRIGISDTKLRNKTSLIVDTQSGGNTLFNEAVDAKKVLRQGRLDSPNIYLISDDNKYTDIKCITSLDNVTFKIGFGLDLTGPLALNFENISLFTNKYYVYLTDKYENKTILLNESTSVYCFNKNDKKRFTDDRFELKFATELSGIEYEKSGQNIQHKVFGNTLMIYTENNMLLRNVIIYDLQGRLVVDHKLNSETFSTNLPKGIYVAKVFSNVSTETFKIIIN